MKIVCPEHGGLINVSNKAIVNAFRSPSKSLVFSCPICQEEVLIKNIRLEQEVTLSNVVQMRGRKEQERANGSQSSS